MNDLTAVNDRAAGPVPAAGMATTLCDDRAAFYQGLADLFAAPPTAATLQAWRKDDLAWSGFVGGPSSGLAALRTALHADGDPDAAATRFGIVFGRLFLGIGGPQTVSPYESVHRHGRLATAPAAEMAALLAGQGLSVAHDFPDHLSVELALLARLIAAGDPVEDALIRRLASWVPSFAEGCRRQDPTGLWAGAAAMLAAEVADDLSRRLDQPAQDLLSQEERNRS